MLPPTPFVFLAYAQADVPLANRLKDNLQDYDIRGWTDQATHLAGSFDEYEDLRAAIRESSAVVLVLSAQTRSSRSVKDEIAIAQMYQRPIYLFWMEGNRLADVIPTGCKNLPSFDARAERYLPALQDLAEALYQPSPFSTQDMLLEEITAPSIAPRNPYKGLRPFRNADAGDFFGRDRLIYELVEQVKQQLAYRSGQSGDSSDLVYRHTGETSSDLIDRHTGETSSDLVYRHTGETSSDLIDRHTGETSSDLITGEASSDLIDRHTGEASSPLRYGITSPASYEDEVSARLLAVLGPSGSGKSSVVMAGLVPQLQQGALAESKDWVYMETIVPGVHPVEALALALTSLFPQLSPGSILHDLQDDSARGLHLLLAAYVKGSGRRIILVVDQFEELFTQTATEEERQRFLDLLLAATTEPQGPLFVILTMRADFYDRLLLYPELGRLVKKYHVPIYPMDVEELRAVIEQPARLPDVQMTFEDDLVGNLLFDIRGQMAALPLLQFTLDHLFQHRQGQVLTLHAYHQIGGVRGALAQHAEHIYLSLPTQTHQQIARALFSRLIDPGTLEADATKRRIPLSAFTLTDPTKTAMLAKVIELFTDERLLTINTIRDVATIEVSHEALIGAWTRLQSWLHETRETIRLQQAISADATAWKQHEHSPDRLYRGAQLTEALLCRDSTILNVDEEAFLQESVEKQKLMRAEEQSRLKIYNRRLFLIGAFGVGVGGAGIGFLTNLLHASSSPQFIQPTSQPKSFPYAYRGHTSDVYSVAWSPDGTRIASAGLDKTVQIWDVRNGTLLLSYKGHTDAVSSVAWSPDGKRIASAGHDTTVQVWDANNGSLLLSYRGHTFTVGSAAWSPDGQSIASIGYDMTVLIWDASNGITLFSHIGHTFTVGSAAWSPDGQSIAFAGEDTTVQIWNVSNATRIFCYTNHTAPVHSLAWSPDGKRIVSAGYDKTVQVWNVSDGSSPLFYTGHTNFVESVAWSPDGKRIASSGYDMTVQVWDANKGTRLFSYTEQTNSVHSVAWSPNGRCLASASGDRTVWVRSTSSGTLLLSYPDHNSFVNSVSWSPDGMRIASSGDDHAVQVWDASSGIHLFSYTGRTVRCVAWSPDGTRIASAGDDNTVRVWDTSDHTLLLTYTGHTSSVLSLAWSPNSMRIASAGDDNTVQVWDANDGTTRFTYTGHASYVLSVAWSPEGERIASAGLDKTVQVWNASNGTLLLTYTGHASYVKSVAWSPDGKHIASGGNDTTMQVWDVSNGTRLFSYTGRTSYVNSVAWSPDGMRIAFTSEIVQVWNPSKGTPLLSYTGHASYVNSVAWSPDGMRIASASADKTVQVWWML